MTPEQAFVEAASSRFEQHKLASFGALLKGVGGLKGMLGARVSQGGAGMMQHLQQGWQGLEQSQKQNLIRAGLTGTVGAVGGLASRNEGDGVGTTLGRVALGAGAGLAVGRYAGPAVNKAQGWWAQRAAAAPPVTG